MARVVLAVVLLGLAIYSLIDCVQSPRRRVRGLPKPLWLIVIVILPVIGAASWLLFGRPVSESGIVRRTAPRPIAPDDDPDFLRDLDRRRPPQRPEARRPDVPSDEESGEDRPQ